MLKVLLSFGFIFWIHFGWQFLSLYEMWHTSWYCTWSMCPGIWDATLPTMSVKQSLKILSSHVIPSFPVQKDLNAMMVFAWSCAFQMVTAPRILNVQGRFFSIHSSDFTCHFHVKIIINALLIMKVRDSNAVKTYNGPFLGAFWGAWDLKIVPHYTRDNLKVKS